MNTRTGRRAVALICGTVLISGGLTMSASAADPVDPSRFTATGLTPTSTITSMKSASGQLAQSDPALLKRTDSAAVPIMVKLDFDAAASYTGDLTGLPATSPEVTGRPLSKSDPAVVKYLGHADRESAAAGAGIHSAVPSAKITGSFTTVYGGLAVTLPANQAKKLLTVPGVAAVQQDVLAQPAAEADSYETSAAAGIPGDTAKFIGATKVWPSLGGQKLAGKGVILGVLDTGIWPQHPMLADNGYLPKPGASGKTWSCQFGDGTDSKLGDPFACNNKLIGAYAFTDTNLSVNGTVDGEFCDTALTTAAHPFGTCSARDADGHGTHTSTTAAGDPVTSTPLLGVDRGPISGIAPGASVIMYRVCLTNGCYGSDSVRAVNQAITDGVNTVNFSIGGGANPYTDPVELAFLDAYAAGVSVSASAGNSGPGAATAEHGGPWVTTVGASTADRAFQSTLTLTSSDGATYAKPGATITEGVSDKPVVLAASVPGYAGGALCTAPFAAGTLTGTVVVCERGTNGRVEKGYNASLGGAAGMILYNPTASDTETDNHFLPAIHLEGPNTEMLAFLAAHPDVTANWARGEVVASQGDVMAGFSSRGPVGSDFLKPDITAPGVQVLAGLTPASIDQATGPTGQLYQAIAGTSMASPHSAGVSILVKAAHPSWTAGQIKSALMTSSVQAVVNSDGSTATPFDRGAGSIRANRAVSPTVTFDVKANDYVTSSTDQLDRVDLNMPSLDADPLPGVLTTSRTAKNVTGSTQTFTVVVAAAAGLAIAVTPKTFTLAPNAKQKLSITLDGTDLADGSRVFGQITLRPRGSANSAVLPIAAHRAVSKINIAQSCTANPVMPKEVSTCTVTAQNKDSVDSPAKVTVAVPEKLSVNFVSPPATLSSTGPKWSGALAGAAAPAVDSVLPGAGPSGGYLPLSLFGIAPIVGAGDETISNFNVPAFTFGGETYTSVGVDSNGYVVVGGGDSTDNNCCDPQTFPNVSRPNNVIAPYWTDLNPATGGSIRVGTLTDGVTSWLVVDYDKVVDFGTTAANSFQIWIQVGTTEGQWISYGDLAGPNSQPLSSGVENRVGTSGVNITAAAANSEFAVTMGDPTPGGSVTFRYQVSGTKVGTYNLIAAATAAVVKGSTTVKTVLTIAK